MEPEVIFNLALLPNNDFSQKLVSYSQRLSTVQSGLYVLGENSFPHVTLLQFSGKQDEAQILWDKVKHLAGSAVVLDFLGLALAPWNEWHCLWLRARRTHQLEKLQQSAIEAIDRSSYYNQIGEAYDPHSTLLAWKKTDIIPNFPIDDQLIGVREGSARLALGTSGPQFQFSKLLFN